jgi:hypothetical protein
VHHDLDGEEWVSVVVDMQRMWGAGFSTIESEDYAQSNESASYLGLFQHCLSSSNSVVDLPSLRDREQR